jgi:hypothetical protein
MKRRRRRTGSWHRNWPTCWKYSRPWPAAHGMDWEDIVSEASRKRGERGGFDQRIFLEYVDQAR